MIRVTDRVSRPLGRLRAVAGDEALLALGALVALLMLGALTTLHYRVYEGDTLSRIYSSASVVHSARPSLTNIGFVWAPLPVLLQVPLALVMPLVRSGMIAVVMSAVFAVLGLLVLNRILRPLLPDQWMRMAILALYQTNAMILIYTINGMTELMLMFFVMVGVLIVQRLLTVEVGSQRKLLLPLAALGAAAGLAFLTRYEGSVFGAVLFLAVPLALLGRTRDRGRYEAYALVYLLPFVYAIAAWMLANWMIMGDPIYFMNSEGSNRDQTSALVKAHPFFQALQGNIPLAIAYARESLWRVFPAYFIVMPALVALAVLRRDRFAVVLVLLLLSVPAFQVLLHISGSSFGWLRFYIYVIPLTIIGLVLVTSRLRGQAGLLAQGAVLVLLAISSATTYRSIITPTPVGGSWYGMYQENQFALALLGGQPINNFVIEREVAEYLRAKDPEVRILADERQADHIEVFSGEFTRFVNSRFPGYKSIVARPVGRVDYILVPGRTNDTQNFILEHYPGIYERGAPFIELEREWQTIAATGAAIGVGSEQFGHTPWRLYRVKGPNIAESPVPPAEPVSSLSMNSLSESGGFPAQDSVTTPAAPVTRIAASVAGPVESTTESSDRRPGLAEEATVASAPAQPSLGQSEPAEAEMPSTLGYRLIVIQYGDTLSRIAQQHGVDVDRLVELNQMANPDLILAGEQLKVPAPLQGRRPPPALPDAPYVYLPGLVGQTARARHRKITLGESED